MCSRFEVDVRPRELARRYGFDDLPAGFTTGEVRPTDPALVIDAGGARVLRWGISVTWDDKPLINARAETLAQKPTFRPLLGNRCIVPASAYFEWRRDGARRLKNRIAPADRGVMAFAGLHDGGRFVIITSAPAADIAHIHDRMPVVLASGAESHWCRPDLDFGPVAELLAPAPAGTLAAEEEVPMPPAQADLFGS